MLTYCFKISPFSDTYVLFQTTNNVGRPASLSKGTAERLGLIADMPQAIYTVPAMPNAPPPPPPPPSVAKKATNIRGQKVIIKAAKWQQNPNATYEKVEYEYSVPVRPKAPPPPPPPSLAKKATGIRGQKVIVRSAKWEKTDGKSFKKVEAEYSIPARPPPPPPPPPSLAKKTTSVRGQKTRLKAAKWEKGKGNKFIKTEPEYSVPVPPQLPPQGWQPPPKQPAKPKIKRQTSEKVQEIQKAIHAAQMPSPPPIKPLMPIPTKLKTRKEMGLKKAKVKVLKDTEEKKGRISGIFSKMKTSKTSTVSSTGGAGVMSKFKAPSGGKKGVTSGTTSGGVSGSSTAVVSTSSTTTVNGVTTTTTKTSMFSRFKRSKTKSTTEQTGGVGGGGIEDENSLDLKAGKSLSVRDSGFSDISPTAMEF